MRFLTQSLLLASLGLFGLTSTANELPEHPCKTWESQPLKALHSNKDINLCKLTAQKTVLIVNTASHCGYTKQFSGLEALHQKYKSLGLTVIGLPSNDFNQEASDHAEIADVCYRNFGVSFTMTEPVRVKGNKAHPLFKQLTAQSKAPSWNFNKYLIGPDGNVIEHFSSQDTPTSERITTAIDTSLIAISP